MPILTLYGRPGCHLCQRAERMLAPLCESLGLGLRPTSIEGDPALTERYGERIPVAVLNELEVLSWPFTRAEARAALAPVSPR